MAGPPNGNVISPAEAKRRLLELGNNESLSSKLLGSPVARAGLLLVGGALLGRLIGRRGKGGAGASLRRAVLRTGLAAAPLLVEQFVRGMSTHTDKSNGRQARSASGGTESP